jgi:hypothetical protein
MIEAGTRTRQNVCLTLEPNRQMTKSYTRDVGMSKNVSASITFGSGEILAANGTFAAFGFNDVVLIENTNQNNGYFLVTGIDATNHAFLTLQPPPKAEGPITATVRTA